MVQWLCDHCVVLGICVPKVYYFTFLLVLSVEMMAPKTKDRKGKRSKKDLGPESEKIQKTLPNCEAATWSCMVWSLWDCRRMTAQYQ